MEQYSKHEVYQQEILSKDLDWFAGIIDSEGCFRASFVKDGLAVRFYLGNCDPNLIKEVERIAKNLNLKYSLGCFKQKNKKHRDTYALYISGYKNLKKLLDIITLRLYGKKQRAELLIKLCELRLNAPHTKIKELELSLVEQIKNLNRKGQNPQRLYVEQSTHIQGDTLKIKSELHGDMQSTSEMAVPSLDWLGGFIDGDGYVALSKTSGDGITPIIGFANTDNINIQAVISFFKEKNLPYYVATTKARKIQHKVNKAIVVRGLKRCDKVLPLFIKSVRSKNKQVQITLEFIKRRLSKTNHDPLTEEDFKNFEDVKELNRRGK